MNFSDSENNFFLPKDIFGMINAYENTYPTYGISSSFNLKMNSHSNMIIDYSYFKEFNNIINNLSFHTFAINLIGEYNFFSIKTEFNIFFSKNFFESSQFLILEENTMYGVNLDLNIYKKISIFGEFKNTFYDVDFYDGVNKISYINMGLKLKY